MKEDSMKALKLILRVVPALLLLLAQPALSQTFGYSVSSEGDDNLYRLTLNTGAESVVGPVGFADVEALAFHPLTGVLFGVDDATDTLITIDTATGAGTAVGVGVGNLGVAVNDVGLTFDSLGNLWMSTDTGQTFYTVDPTTGAATPIGPLGQEVTGLAAFRTAIYGLGGDGTDNLVTIDTGTGAATAVGPLVNPLSFTDGGIAFDASGTLWKVTDPPGEICTIDPATGVGTFVALVTSGRYESLAIEPPTSGFCGAAPATGCMRVLMPGKAGFRLSAKGAKGSWRWSWNFGDATTAADYGQPLTGTSYSLCVYDHVGATPVLVMNAFASPGSNWRSKGGVKFSYSNRTPPSDGISRIRLKTGIAGKANIKVGARGNPIDMPPMPLVEDTNVTVQFLGLHGPCWEAEYPAPAKRNTATKYDGQGD